MSSAASVADALFVAHPALTSPAERRLARLLAKIDFFAASGLLLFTATSVVTAPRHVASALLTVMGPALLCALAAYGFSRTRHLRLATGVSIGLHVLIPIGLLAIGTIGQPIFGHAALFVFSMLFCGALARPRTTLLVGAVCCAASLAAGLVRGAAAADVASTVTFLLNVGGMTFALGRHRDRVEQDRSAQLRARNAELVLLKQSLEARVASRTSELQTSRDDLDLAYQALQQNQQSLLTSEKMASLGRLTAGIAHEMSSPIAAVRSALSDLNSLDDEYERSIGDASVEDDDHRAIAAEMRGAITLAAKAAERAASFVRSIKSQTRDVGAHQRVAFDAVGTVRDAVQMLGHEATAACSRVDFRCVEERIEVVGFPGKLSQVVTNLVSNALDANAERGGGTVTLVLERRGDMLALVVTDEGPGIATDTIGRIFDPLFTTKAIGKGTGLGLTIVHGIVHGDLGGRIDVVNLPGRGARFAVQFPA